MIYFELLHRLQISSDGLPNDEGQWPNWRVIVSDLKEQRFPSDAFLFGNDDLDLQAKKLIYSMLCKIGLERPKALGIKKELTQNLRIDEKGKLIISPIFSHRLLVYFISTKMSFLVISNHIT